MPIFRGENRPSRTEKTGRGADSAPAATFEMGSSVKNAYLFLGFVKENGDWYSFLRAVGYLLVFKETMIIGSGKIKGNCDADLVLYAVVGYYEKKFEKAVIVSSDGDLAVLVHFLKERGILRILLSPSDQCSYLLRKANVPLVYLNTQRNILEKTC
jgi:uncharacterized LabA/DUF88 family protein